MAKIVKTASFLFIFQLVVGSSLLADDFTLLGGAMTAETHFTGIEMIQLPASNVTKAPEHIVCTNLNQEERKSYRDCMQSAGFGPFHADFSFAYDPNSPDLTNVGLGPDFNSRSCAACHHNTARGSDVFSKRRSSMIIKVAVKNRRNPDRSPVNLPFVGEQIKDQSITPKKKFNYDIKLTYKDKTVKYPDGQRVTLRRPKLSFKVPGPNGTILTQRKVAHSLRMTPPIIGAGLLEAIPEETLIALSDPYDLNSDGISGEVQYAIDLESNTKKVGRFGFRASHPSLRQQNAAAAFNDMGLTNSLFSGQDNEELELSDDTLHEITMYLVLASVPYAVNQNNPEVKRGQDLFRRVNCSACHTMTHTTGVSEINPEVSNQEIHAFTDLLLHDMGADLADKRVEFEASGREWKTPPLWGIGRVLEFARAEPMIAAIAPPSDHMRFLHDGRARTIEEAILWHGGEAQASKEAFMALSASERSDLIKFLESL